MIRQTLKRFSSFKHISDSQVADFFDQGYLVLPNFFAKNKVEALKNEAESLMGQLKEEDLNAFFDTQHNLSDDYFFTSGDKIRYFLEGDALDEEGKFKYPLNKCINKIGHGYSLNSSSRPQPSIQRVLLLRRS